MATSFHAAQPLGVRIGALMRPRKPLDSRNESAPVIGTPPTVGAVLRRRLCFSSQFKFRFSPLSAFHPPVCQLPRGIRSLSLVYGGQVSVSVRPERLSVAGTARDTGHHSRLVPRSFCWPPRHAALAPTALAAASRSVGLSHCPRLWVRQVAPRLTWPAGSGRGRSRCTVCGFDAR